MGNCNDCFERERARVTAWGGEVDDGEGGDYYYYHRGTAPAESSGAAPASFRKKEKDGGSPPPTTTTARVLKIRMTKGQLRRLLDGAGKGLPVEDVVAEIMAMGDVHVEPMEAAAAEGHRPPPKLETIQEDDMDE